MSNRDQLQLISDLLTPIHIDIREINLKLEKEINRCIQAIADGQSIASRHPDEIQRAKHEKELILSWVNQLENQLRKIKQQLQEMA